MLRRACVAIGLLLLCGCSTKQTSQPVGDGEMTGNFYGEVPAQLFVDPAAVQRQSGEFLGKLKALGPGSIGKRSLYEEYVPVIGANGVLDGITKLWPTCHSEAHDLGKVIYASTQDVDLSLRICHDGCYSGCMHGVMMEAYAGARDKTDPEGHVNPEVVRMMMQDMCSKKSMKESYSPGDCAHATGHALMVLAEYDIDTAIGWCDQFDEDHMRYYCATGAYMEYVTEKDRADVEAKKPILYPCESHKYPAACARYKMVHVIPRLMRSKADVTKMAMGCQHLKDPYRIGCFHGIGNGFMPAIAKQQLTIAEVCGMGNEDEAAACIDGAMERMAKYSPDAATAVCKSVEERSQRRLCNEARERGMYNMEKDLSPYLH